MNVLKRKNIYSICVIGMTLTLFFGSLLSLNGCAKKDAGASASVSNLATKLYNTPQNTATPAPTVAGRDLQGRVIKILKLTYSGIQGQEGDNDVYGPVTDVLAQDTSPMAKYELEKYQKLEKKYNCTFEYVSFADGYSSFSSLTPTVDLVMGNLLLLEMNYFEGTADYLLPLEQYKDILKLDDSTLWNTKVQKTLAMGGPTLLLSNNDTYNNFFLNKVVFVNISMLKNAGLWEKYNLYEMVKNGTWNWNTLKSLCKLVSKDTDGDKKTDIFGLSLGSFGENAFIIANSNGGTDCGYVTMNSKGKATVDAKNPAKKAAVDFLASLYDAGYMIHVMADSEAAGSDRTDSFVNGRYLFCVKNAAYFSKISEKMTDEWGMLPIPVGPDNKNHTYFTANDSATYYGIFKNAQDTQDLAYVLRDLAQPAIDPEQMRSVVADEVVAKAANGNPGNVDVYLNLTNPEHIVFDPTAQLVNRGAVGSELFYYIYEKSKRASFYTKLVPEAQKNLNEMWNSLLSK